jgi:hypothetical protein
MLKPLAFHKEVGDLASSITLSAVGRSKEGDVVLRIEIEDPVNTVFIDLTKWHFHQLIAEAEERLQKI